jgi:carbon-monoxide dehydrogenase large subunit
LSGLCDLAAYAHLTEERRSRRAGGALFGLGFGFYIEPCGRGWESARVQLNRDGRITAATGTSAQGHGRETAFAQIVADVFDVPSSRVTVLHGDTGTCPDGIGALASRSTGIGGSALLRAAQEVKEKSRRDARPKEPVEAGVVYEAEGETWGYGCCLAAVSVDRDTGEITVEHMFCVEDAGTVVNPMLTEGQIHGGIAQGLGEAMLERMVYDGEGQLLTGSFMDYAMPRADQVPQIEIRSLATPTPLNPLGAKGVGEAGTIGAPAAILNAALDALAPLGVRHLELPLTGERLWRAIKTAETE